MRYIEGLRDIYKDKEKGVYNKDIWVIGCSPWLEDYPGNFFDDKISIRLNFSIVAFPVKKDYHYAHWYHSTFGGYLGDGKRGPGIRPYIDSNVPEIYDRVILPIPHESFEKPEDWGEHYEKIIWMKYYDGFADEDKLKGVVRRILRYRLECRHAALATIAHTGIQIALVMGAKRVILAACEGKTTVDSADAQSRGMDKFYHFCGPEADKRKMFYIEGIERPEKPTTKLPKEEQEGTSPRRIRHRDGIKWITEEASLYGREVVRHSYKKGYEPVL